MAIPVGDGSLSLQNQHKILELGGRDCLNSVRGFQAYHWASSWHAGVNYAGEHSVDEDKSVNFFAGMDATFDYNLALTMEYDFALNDNEGTTILSAVKAAADAGARVEYNRDGNFSEFQDVNGNPLLADVGIVVLAEDPYAEGVGDRADLSLNEQEIGILEETRKYSQHIVVILISGRPRVITNQLDMADAWVAAWLPGTEGGGIADVLFGDYNPAGRLVQTWPKSLDQLPPMMDYDIRNGRTYMYFKDKPLYPFGFGLSYSTFAFANLRLSAAEIKPGQTLKVSVEVTNTSAVTGDEVVQLYIHQKWGSDSRPMRELKGFERITLQPGETKTVTFHLGPDELGYWSTNANGWIQEAAAFDIWVGADSLATLHADLEVVS